jgi:hypothetical protein
VTVKDRPRQAGSSMRLSPCLDPAKIARPSATDHVRIAVAVPGIHPLPASSKGTSPRYERKCTVAKSEGGVPPREKEVSNMPEVRGVTEYGWRGWKMPLGHLNDPEYASMGVRSAAERGEPTLSTRGSKDFSWS